MKHFLGVATLFSIKILLERDSYRKRKKKKRKEKSVTEKKKTVLSRIFLSFSDYIFC